MPVYRARVVIGNPLAMCGRTYETYADVA